MQAQINRPLTQLLSLFVLVALTLCSLPALAQPAAGVVNINTAGSEQLTYLPRIGPALAQRILDFRQENGQFERPEDLILVRGIGEKTYTLMAPFVVTTGETTLSSKARPTPPAEENH